MSRISVDLPEPLAPRIPSIRRAPGGARRRDRDHGLLLRATLNRFVTWSTSSAGIAGDTGDTGRSVGCGRPSGDTTADRVLFSCGVVVVVTVGLLDDGWTEVERSGLESRKPRVLPATVSSRGHAARMSRPAMGMKKAVGPDPAHGSWCRRLAAQPPWVTSRWAGISRERRPWWAA